MIETWDIPAPKRWLTRSEMNRLEPTQTLRKLVAKAWRDFHRIDPKAARLEWKLSKTRSAALMASFYGNSRPSSLASYLGTEPPR